VGLDRRGAIRTADFRDTLDRPRLAVDDGSAARPCLAADHTSVMAVAAALKDARPLEQRTNKRNDRRTAGARLK
jgi:hypothetical protein